MRIKCKGYIQNNYTDGYSYECGYEPSFDCDECIINGGHMSPVSDKPFRGNREPYEKDCIERWEANKENTQRICDNACDKIWEVVNHKDEIKDNNCFTNLEWCTQKYNMNYGGVKKKISLANSKKVKAIKNTNEIVFQSAMEAQRLLGISNGCINECLKGKRRTAGGYKWEYVK